MSAALRTAKRTCDSLSALASTTLSPSCSVITVTADSTRCSRPDKAISIARAAAGLVGLPRMSAPTRRWCPLPARRRWHALPAARDASQPVLSLLPCARHSLPLAQLAEGFRQYQDE